MVGATKPIHQHVRAREVAHGPVAVLVQQHGVCAFGDRLSAKDDAHGLIPGLERQPGRARGGVAHTEKLSPQPQRDFSFGLRKTNPDSNLPST